MEQQPTAAADATMGPLETPALVSVVIATYNCAAFVADAVRSVLAQTYPSVEVQLIDDGSTDGTEAAIAPLLADSRLRYHRQANAGQTRAKNAGIRRATGEFIAFCDADDMWLPQKLSLQIRVFDQNPQVGVVYTRYARIDERGGPLPLDDEPDFKVGRVTEDLFKTNFVPFGTAVVRRQCFEELGPFDERHRMGIDWELWLRLSTKYEFAFVPEVTYLYRLWGGQMSRDWVGRYDHAFRIMNEFLEQHPSLVRPAVVREAWADSYVQRARMRVRQPGQFWPAVADLGRAVRCKPGFFPAWRSFGRVLLSGVGAWRT